MYWLIECNPKTGLETNRFKYKFLAQKEMKRRYGEHNTAERVSYLCEFAAIVNADIGTYEWQIVGEGDPERERILGDIENCYGKDFLESEDMTEFFIDHWDEYQCAMDIECYAILNTIFGYDIGSDNAKKINNWLYEKFNMTAFDIPSGDDADNLMRVAKWDLGLDLDFSNFNADIEAIRYDW